MTRILISGRSSDYVAQLHERVAELGPYELESNVLVNGVRSPLTGLNIRPDILILVVTDNQIGELEDLAKQPASDRVPLVVIGDQLEPGAMRTAMQAGARDFLSAEAEEEQLAETLRLLVAETENCVRNSSSTVISVINAAGGNGSSTLAVNMAAGIASAINDGETAKVAAIDLDLQFASLSKYYDKSPQHSLLDALERIDELDKTALTGYFVATQSKVDLACAHPMAEILNRDSLDTPFQKFLDMASGKYDWIVLDVPSQLDALGASTLEASKHVVLVMQQTLKSIHQANCMLETMRQNLAIAPERVTLVVNRYHKNAALELSDIKRVVKSDPIIALPNDFALISESNELGQPFYSQQSKSATSEAIRELLVHLGAMSAPPIKSIFSRTFSGLLRS